MSYTNLKLTHWIHRGLVVLLPLFISFSWMTLVIGPAYPRYEYGKPGFPPDLSPATAANLGLVPMTQAKRLALALVAVTYLESWQPAEVAVTLVAEQQLPHTGTPLYNQRELNHLVDVKHLTDTIRWMALLTAVPVVGGLAYLLARPQTRQSGYLALAQGGLATVFILSVITGFILWGWGFSLSSFMASPGHHYLW